MPRDARVSTQDSALSTQHLAAITVAALAALVYVNALWNGLVWDDPIVLNRQLLAFRSLHDIIFTPRNIPQYSPDYYRPLTTLSYLLDRAIAGDAPFMFHLSVLLYHVVATYLVFRLGLRLFALAAAALPAAMLAAALFAVHPIHSESVAWDAGRSDVLAACFGLLAVLAYRRADWTAWRRALTAAGLTFAAALAKETAVSFFALVPAMDLILERLPSPRASTVPRAERRRERQPSMSPLASPWLIYLPFAAAFVVYIVLRQAALNTVLGEARASGVAMLESILAAIGVYVGKLLLPISQCAFISDLPTSGLALATTAALLAVFAAGAWIAWDRGQRLVVFLLLWIGLTLAPSLTIVAKIPAAPIAERYLYLPSIGFCLLVGYGAAALFERRGRTVVITAMALLMAAGAVATVRRNAVWRTNLTLWEDTAAKNTTDGMPARSLGAAYLEQGDHAKARQYFQLALQRRNDAIGQFVIYNNLGSLAMAEKRLDDAEQLYRTALTLNPSAADTLFNLGLIALTRATDKTASDTAAKRDHALRARQLFEQAQQQHPLDSDIVIALGQTLTALGDPRGARAQYARALQLGLPESTAASVRTLLAELPPEP
jgi:protein O-mannosyl-transferase